MRQGKRGHVGKGGGGRIVFIFPPPRAPRGEGLSTPLGSLEFFFG